MFLLNSRADYIFTSNTDPPSNKLKLRWRYTKRYNISILYPNICCLFWHLLHTRNKLTWFKAGQTFSILWFRTLKLLLLKREEL